MCVPDRARWNAGISKVITLALDWPVRIVDASIAEDAILGCEFGLETKPPNWFVIRQSLLAQRDCCCSVAFDEQKGGQQRNVSPCRHRHRRGNPDMQGGL